ncbi:hypothetical protein SKAU_G00320860 [Synaphobranchus kaupii]|uniref:Macro domain-containing protein n=1 Tax=Synaphobranchus kaupii TaxID=118154 RepID=A0A9Q1ENM9_SYNKA|nr:hypothetical protein SKAU_G00320860 [Synaphobranchus kaupii]
MSCRGSTTYAKRWSAYIRYQQALGTALYGTDRPEWKLPEAFTENLHPALGKFLLQESQLAAISAQMQAQFCQVEFSTEHAKLRPLPGLLKQKGLTANRIEGWRGEASQAFRSIVARYRCFECPVSSSVWKAAEREIRQAVSEDAVLLPNLPNGVVAIAGLAKDVDRIQKEVEEMVQRAANQLERERDGVSEEMVMSPGMHSILQQAGLQSVFTQTYPALSITYRSDTQRLVLSGLPTEVIMVKNWVLEKKLEMKQRTLDLEPDLLGFLSTANSEEISQKLFTSCGVSAVYKMENKGLVLVGASEEALSKADRLLKEALAFQSVEVEDEAVLRKQEWAKLKRQLMEANNSSGQSTVSIQLSHQGCVTVTGFRKAVQDVADSLSRFLNQHSCVEEAVPVRTTAILIFLQEHKATDWRQRADAEEVSVRFQDKKPQVVLGGARFRVQGLKRLFAQLDAALCTDRLKIIKPGARKYFLEKKQIISIMMKDKKCVVVLQEEGEQEEEEPMTQAVKTVVADVRRPMLSQSSPEAEQRREETVPQAAEWNSPSERQWSSADQSRYKPSESMGELEALHTKEGLLIVLRKGNIEDASTDVIVNTISVDLDLRKGAVSKAILQAAGPQLQGAVRDQARRGEAEYGDVMHTDGFQLKSDIFHTICPFWNDGAGQAEQTLINTVKTCLRDAEKQKARSLAFPAIGTGNLGFPKPLVAKTMLSEVQGFGHKRALTHLRKVVFMVHPSDTQTVECFVREFRGQAQRQGGPSRKHYGQSQQDRFHSSQSEQAFFGQVSSPTLGVHSMGIGH